MNDIEGGEQSASFEPAGLVDRVPIPVERKATGLRPVTQLWWLTGFCLAMAVGLGSWAWFTRGIQIHLQFGNGHGLRAENRLMHRGIEVGVVESVQLDQVLEKVDVVVRLNRSAGALACEGSRFWIERPMASIQGVRSLETILSGRYIAVEPGSLTGPPSYRFQGLETPPQPPVSQGALEVVLEGNHRHGLQVNAPVIYRGLEVGLIQSVGLSADSRWVQIRAVIDEDYRTLVRENSRFWNRSGFRIDVGLSGLQFDAESLSTVAMGGVEFATPDPPADTVKTGRRFELASQADESWLKWRPRLLYGAILPKGLDMALTPIRLSQHWQEKLFGFRQNQSRIGWILMLSDGTAIGPRELFEQPAKAIDDSTRWEVAGFELRPNQVLPFPSDASRPLGHPAPTSTPVSRYRIGDFSAETPAWPVERLAGSIDNQIRPERLWVTCDVPSRWIPIEPHQLVPAKDDGWLIDSSLGISVDQHGAPVFDSQTGQVVGIVIVDQRVAHIYSCQ